MGHGTWPAGKGIPSGVCLPPHLGRQPRHRGQHYAGVAFDVGQRSLTQSRRTAIYKDARSHRSLGLCGAPEARPQPGCTLTAATAPRPAALHSELPHPAAWEPGLLMMILQDAPLSTQGTRPAAASTACSAPAPRSPERLPAPHQPDGGRRVWLQQLEKDATAVLGIGRTKTTIGNKNNLLSQA